MSASDGTSLLYDPLGRLFQVSGSAGTTQSLYDGDALVAEYDGAGTLTRRYVHGPGMDEPVAVYEGAALGTAHRRYMLPDERGSIVGLINADGSPSVINTYDEYGIPGAANDGRFQYTGQIWIPELGLYYYKARLYSPFHGRFLQVDPIGYDDQINLYTYVGNDPVNDTDSTGESRGRGLRSPPAGGMLNTQLYSRNIRYAQSVWPNVKIQPSLRLPNSGHTLADVQYSTGLVRTMAILGPSNFGGSVQAQADPAGRGFQQALYGSKFNPTSRGTPQWTSTGNVIGQSNAFYLMTGRYPTFDVNGVARSHVDFGNGLNVSVTAYRSSSGRDDHPPSIFFEATQSVRPTGSRISIDREVMAGKIRF